MKKGSAIKFKKPLSLLKNEKEGLNAIYMNGHNDLYPYHVEKAINESSTASLAHRMHYKYIAGILGIEDFVVNNITGDTLSLLRTAAAVDLSYHNGFFIHINYAFDVETDSFKPVNPTILNYPDCRLNKQDDKGYWSKVFVDDFSKTTGKFNSKKTGKWYYRYNPDKSVIIKQIKKDAEINEIEDVEEALRSYRGQVAYVKATAERPYTTSIADAVLNDCVSEAYISQYVNAQTVNGFAGKAVAFIRAGDDEEENEAIEMVQNWIGTDNSGGIYVQTVDDTDDVEKMLKVVNFQGTFDDKMFEKTERSLRKKILGAFDNLPEILVYSGEGAMFGSNPETYVNAQKFYSNNTQELRELLNNSFLRILGIDMKLISRTEQIIDNEA